MLRKQLTPTTVSSYQVVAAAALLVAAACGSDGDPTPGQADGGISGTADAAPDSPDAAPGPVAAGELCDELTSILCRAEQSCCTDQGSRHATVDACIAAEKPACLDSLQAPANDAQTGYDPVIARAELSELAGLAASCDAAINPWFVSHQGLLRIYQGTVASGGDCSPASASDTAPVLSCQAPAVCRLTALPLSGTCGAARSSGDSCVTEVECADGLRCDPPESLTGTCKARLADGMSCGDNGDCESLICRGATCQPATVNNVYCFAVD